jgi:hypothetical protein
MGAASCFSGSTFRLVNGSDSHPLVTRILVVRFSSMGDVILTTPVVRALHAMLEGDVEVHFLTKSPFAAAVRNLEGVSRVWTMERTTAEVEDDLKAVGFHYVVDLHANARSGFVKRALRADGGRTFDLTVNKRSLDKILLVRTGWDRLAGQHVVERYLATLRPFGDARAALARVGDDASLQLPLRPSEGKKEGVVLALGAAHVGKSIPESHWRGIVKGLRSKGEQVTLIGVGRAVVCCGGRGAVFVRSSVLGRHLFNDVDRGGLGGWGYRCNACGSGTQGAHGRDLGMYIARLGNGPLESTFKDSSIGAGVAESESPVQSIGRPVSPQNTLHSKGTCPENSGRDRGDS